MQSHTKRSCPPSLQSTLRAGVIDGNFNLGAAFRDSPGACRGAHRGAGLGARRGAGLGLDLRTPFASVVSAAFIAAVIGVVLSPSFGVAGEAPVDLTDPHGLRIQTFDDSHIEMAQTPPFAKTHFTKGDEFVVPAAGMVDPSHDGSASAARGGFGDNDTAHYARGSINIIPVLIDHAGGTWSEEERQIQGGKLALVREYIYEHRPDEGYLRFPFEGSGGYYYYPVEVPYNIFDYPDFETWMVADAAERLGHTDDDGDGSNIDEFSIAAQANNGGWNNIILVFIPADYSFSQVQIGNGTSWMRVSHDHDWSLWAHLIGHHLGACDEGGTPVGCGDILCDDICQSEYLYDQVPNGNCQTCNAGQNCVMRAAWVDGPPCDFTRRNWGWIDDDGDGSLDHTRAYDAFGDPYPVYEIENASFVHSVSSLGFAAIQRERNWGVAGVRSAGASNWVIHAYADNNRNHLISQSVGGGGGAVKFVVTDFNQANLGQTFLRVTNFGGDGQYTLTHELGDEVAYANGFPLMSFWGSNEVVRAYDVPLFEGETIQFDLDINPGSPNLDLGMALFKSDDWGYHVGRTASVWEADDWAAGTDETHTFTVPETDTYGLIIFSKTEVSGNFSLKIGPTIQQLTEENPYESSLDLRLYSYWTQHPYWSVVGARPGEGTNATLRLFTDPTYQVDRVTSDFFSGTEFAVVDYHEFQTDDYLRVSRESGVQPVTTEWEHGPEILSGWFTDNWGEGHVCKAWDSYLEEGERYRFQYYGQLGVFNSPRLYLAGPVGSNYKGPEEMIAQGAGDELSTWFEYTAESTGWYGAIVVTDEPDESNYVLAMGPAVDISGGQRMQFPDEVVFANIESQEDSWSILGVLPKGEDTQSSVWMWGCESEYLGCFLEGDAVGSPLTYIAVDGNHLDPTTLYTRVDRNTGLGAQSIVYQVADAEDIRFDDPRDVVTVSGEFGPGEAVDIWDLAIRLNATAVRVEVVPLNDNLDLSVTVHSSRTGDYYQGSDERIAVAENGGPGESEGLAFVATTEDIFGLVVSNMTGVAGAYEIYVFENGAADVEDPIDTALPAELDLRLVSGGSTMAQLELSLPEAGLVRMDIFDTQGRRIRSVRNEHLVAGVHQIEWDGRTDQGVGSSSGVYFARVEALGKQRTVKWVRAR